MATSLRKGSLPTTIAVTSSWRLPTKFRTRPASIASIACTAGEPKEHPLHPGCGGSVVVPPPTAHCGMEALGEERRAVQVLQRYHHVLAAVVDVGLPEELKARRRRQVGLPRWGRLLKHHLRAERVVEHARPEGAGVERARHEFPERIEIAELRFLRVVEVRRAVVHVGGEPHHVRDVLALDEPEQVGELDLAAERRAVAVSP